MISVGVGDPRAEAFASAFVAQFEDWERGLRDALAFRVADPNVTDAERERVGRLLTRGNEWRRTDP